MSARGRTSDRGRSSKGCSYDWKHCELNSDRTSGEGQKSELFDSTSSGARFRITKGVGRPALGRPEGAGNPSYRAHVLLVQGSGFPKLVGRPALGCPEGAGNPSYRAQVLLVQGSGFPKPVGRPTLDGPSDVRREPEVRVIWLTFFWCRAPDFRSWSVDRPSDVRREPEIRVIWLKFFWCRASDFRS